MARRKTRWLRARNVAVLLVMAALGAAMDPALVPPFGPFAERPETHSATFRRCDRPGTGSACVVDGDSFRLGARQVRILGIDAPEMGKPKCAAEGALAERATDRLVALLNAGPFELVSHRFNSEDRYGRDLRLVRRDGVNLGFVLRDEGLAHRYMGMKASWC